MILNQIWARECQEDINTRAHGALVSDLFAIEWVDLGDTYEYQVYPVFNSHLEMFYLHVGDVKGNVPSDKAAERLLSLLLLNEEKSSFRNRSWIDPSNPKTKGSFTVSDDGKISFVGVNNYPSELEGLRAVYTLHEVDVTRRVGGNGTFEMKGTAQELNPRSTKIVDALEFVQGINVRREAGFEVIKLKGGLK